MRGPTHENTERGGAQGVAITFTNLEYSVPLKEGDKLTILNDLNGAFVPGKLTALMGPSGSGK